jgi:hypothetical protein
VVRLLKDNSTLPISVYHVSGARLAHARHELCARALRAQCPAWPGGGCQQALPLPLALGS